jgi:bacteriocin-like protein
MREMTVQELEQVSGGEFTDEYDYEWEWNEALGYYEKKKKTRPG